MHTGRPRVLHIYILIFLFFLGSCGTVKKAYVAKEYEEYYGTWVNTEFNDRQIINPDGTYEHYYGKSNKPRWYGTFTITDKWTDSEGNIWYKTIVVNQIGVSRYVLNRINKSRGVWEYVYFSNDYPNELNPNLMSHRIFNRK
jgi:hypothetical protein